MTTHQNNRTHRTGRAEKIGAALRTVVPVRGDFPPANARCRFKTARLRPKSLLPSPSHGRNLSPRLRTIEIIWR